MDIYDNENMYETAFKRFSRMNNVEDMLNFYQDISNDIIDNYQDNRNNNNFNANLTLITSLIKLTYAFDTIIDSNRLFLLNYNLQRYGRNLVRISRRNIEIMTRETEEDIEEEPQMEDIYNPIIDEERRCIIS